ELSFTTISDQKNYIPAFKYFNNFEKSPGLYQYVNNFKRKLNEKDQ
ncbi:14622_t:CDS:1, partial [Gigaspora rosea]